MASSVERSTASGPNATLFPALMSFPVAAFTGVLITDVAYVRTTEFAWTTFSIWLLTAGLVVAGLAIIIGLIDAFGRGHWPTRIMLVGYAIALVLALVNAFVHSRDAYTTVMPDGLILSVATVVVMLVTVVLSRSAARGSLRQGL